MDEEKIPYDDPSLRSAFRRGWKACLKGKRRPEEQLFDAGERGEAWVLGYEAAGCS